MKKIFLSASLLFLLFMAPILVCGQATIAQQDFNRTLGTPTWTYSASTSGGTAFDTSAYTTAASGERPASTAMYLGTRAYRFRGPSSGTHTSVLTFGAIDTRSYTSISVSLRVAAFATSNTQGLESSGDFVLIEISPDNGTTWYEQAEVTAVFGSGGGNATWAFSGTGSGSRAYATNNTQSTFSSGSVTGGTTEPVTYTGTNAITTATITSLPAVQNLRMRVTLSLSGSNNENLVIDDIVLTGTGATDPILAVTGTTDNGSACPGVAAATKTYTITNTGTAATNVVVSSSDAQFVVSNLSSTSLAANNGTATYDVVFTPTSSGAKTSTISVFYNTSTLATTSSLTGTGTTAATAAVTTNAATLVNNTIATLNGNVTTLGVCPTTTSKGFVYSVTSTNSNPVHGGTGVTPVAVGGLTTGAYLSALTGLTETTGYSYKAYVYDGTTYTYGSVQTFTTLAPATKLAFGTTPPSTGNAGSNLTTFTVQAQRSDNSVDPEYAGTVGLTRTIISGSGNLSGISVALSSGTATFNATQFDAAGTFTITAALSPLTSVTSSNIDITLANAATILWSSSGGTAWLTGSNWTGGSAPSSIQVARFGTNPTPGTRVNINGGTTSVGAIEMTSSGGIDLTIGNNSGVSSSGTLSLNGVINNSVSNTILRNNSSSTLTIQNLGSTGSGSNTMAVALANTTNNIINIDGCGGITITSIISGSNPLTKSGSGSGDLTLSNGNSYTGKTTVTTGFIAATGESAFGANPGVFTADQITLNGGGIKASTGDINFNSNRGLTLGSSGGTFNVASSRTITALNVITGSGALDKTGPGLLLMTGIHTYTGLTTVSAGTLQLNRSGGGTLPATNNVTVNGGTLQVSTNQTLNDLTITTGGLTIDAGVTLTINGTLTITECTHSGSGSIAYGTSRALVYTNTPANLTTTDKDWPVSGGPTSVTVGSNGLTLHAPRSLGGVLTLNGTLTTTSTNLLTLIAGSSTAGSSFVVGPLAKTGNTDFIFPVGKSTKQGRIAVSDISASTTFTAEYFNSAPANSSSLGSGLSGGKISRSEYWDIAPSGAQSAKVTLYWEDASSGIVTGSIGSSDLVVAHYDGANWISEGNSASTGTSSSGTVTSNTVSTWSPFGFGSPSGGINPLPVELLDLKAKKVNETSVITWKTAMELNNDYFSIERKTPTTNYEVIGTVKGSGNSNQILNYSFTDKAPVNNTLNYYRIVQHDFNGVSEAFGPVSTRFGTEMVKAPFFPNPFTNSLTLNIDEESLINKVTIVNTIGVIVFEQTLNETSSLTIGTETWNSGNYFITLSGPSISKTYRQVKF